MLWLHKWSWWDSILPMKSKKQVVWHCNGLNPRWNVKLPKYTGLLGTEKSLSHGKKKTEKEHVIKFQTVQHKSLQMLCNLYGEKKYSPVLISLIVTSPTSKCCFCVVPWEVWERAHSVVSVHAWHCAWEKALDWTYYFSSSLHSSPTPNTLLNHCYFVSNNKAEQVKF